MTGPEQGFLLLTSQLGDPDRKPLSAAQFRNLAKRTLDAKREVTARDLEIEDLLTMGYDLPMAERIYGLLGGTNQLREYLKRAENCDCYPITRLNPAYPLAVRQRLGLDSPGVLWAKGDDSLLNRPAVAVIGSRELRAENQRFAESVGREIAEQGYVLVSGNAKGADRTAQEACLEAGGKVISVVADSLQKQPLRRNILYISLDEFDRGFSAQRALRRNHVIHSMAALTVAAQCTLGKGGTWDGILANLRNGWTPICLFGDSSEAALDMQSRGVQIVSESDLQDLSALAAGSPNFING